MKKGFFFSLVDNPLPPPHLSELSTKKGTFLRLPLVRPVVRTVETIKSFLRETEAR